MTHQFQPGDSDQGRRGGEAAGKVAYVKRRKQWIAMGADPVLMQRAYDMGYQSCNQKWVRKMAAKARPEGA